MGGWADLERQIETLARIMEENERLKKENARLVKTLREIANMALAQANLDGTRS